jgi:hypothetical protein
MNPNALVFNRVYAQMVEQLIREQPQLCRRLHDILCRFNPIRVLMDAQLMRRSAA